MVNAVGLLDEGRRIHAAASGPQAKVCDAVAISSARWERVEAGGGKDIHGW